jgi:hypothetical protein
MSSEISIYQDEKQWISWQLNQLKNAHGQILAYYLNATKMQYVNMEKILSGPTNMKLNTLFALLGAMEAGLPDLISIPQLQKKIRGLHDEMAYVCAHNQEVHLQNIAGNK